MLRYTDGKPDPIPKWRKIWWPIQRHLENIRRFPKQLKYFVWKLWAYAPILWYDQDWDYGFFLSLIKFKLQRMAKHAREHGCIVSSPIQAKQMQYAVFLIDRIQKNEYADAGIAAHDKKWGEFVFNTEPTEDPRLRRVDMYNMKAREMGEEAEKQCDKERYAIYTAADAAREKDLDRLFKHIRKYLLRWWD